ncbi:hypothetical protein JKP88DRAFT_173139 [Tribonema minus]|uniref:Uncharacterized protein n=1 Tax=Tribonema minus TaxID=303371 RepID=A0A835ZPP5_9STRA|nr:hypothetical protein JKP88DRAFT_173139 [Tribonema minus]
MSDEPAGEKKPRTRMNAEELLEETSQAMEKAVAFLESNGLHAASVENVRHLTSALAWSDALHLTQSLGFTMPHIDHDAFIVMLLDTWECVAQMKLNSRRACYRKVRVLEADQKTDPEVLAKWLADRARVDKESAATNLSYIKMRQILRAGEPAGNTAGGGAATTATQAGVASAAVAG